MTTAETATDTATDTAGTTRLTDVAESAGPAAPIGPESPLSDIFELAQQLRVDSIRSSTAAGSGHPTSGMSAADLMAVLMARHLRYDWLDPGNPANDYLIFSKGHASPLLYSMFKAAGVVSDQELVETYRRAGSRLQGHPTPVLPWVPAATGSLGQGIGIGVGIAQACRTVTPSPSRIWVLCGDSEMTEGSVWEALDRAGNDGLANFTLVVDVNRLGQRGPTELGWDLRSYARRVEGFGCVPLLVEGHDLGQIDDAFREAADSGRPTVILARTRKGRGFSEVENKPGWHGKALPPDMAERAVAELGGERSLTVRGREPAAVAGTPTGPWPGAPHVDLPEYRLGVPVAPRAAVGEALAALGVRPEVVVLDAEVGNSTHTEDFGKAYPDRYFECYIAEQQMTASAVGMSVRRLKPFAATFAAF
jgi:transketolase